MKDFNWNEFLSLLFQETVVLALILSIFWVLILGLGGANWLTLIALCISLLTYYGAFIEPSLIVKRKVEVSSFKIKKEFRVVLLTDIHVGPYKGQKYLQRVFNEAVKTRPQLILLGGDFISSSKFRANDLDPLSKIPQGIPKFAVLGNHDYNMNFTFSTNDDNLARSVEQKLESEGVRVLRNEAVSVDVSGQKINLVGVDDLWAHKDDLGSAYEKIAEDTFTLLLSHNPDIVLKLGDHKPDIVLSGHTHGNTVRLPFLGPLFPLIKNVKLAKRYSKGFHNYNGTLLYVSAGLGETVTRVRLFNPPEMIVLDFKPEKQ